MASTYSSRLRLELQANGENDGTWGTKLATSLQHLEHSIAGRATVTHDNAANYTLTSNDGSDDEARYMILNITGTLTAARNVVVPTVSKLYVVKNATTGGFAIVVKTSGGSGVTIPNGLTMVLMCDGTDVLNAISSTGSMTFAGDIAIQGNTTVGNDSADTLTVNSTTVTWANTPTHSGTHVFSGSVTGRRTTTGGGLLVDTTSSGVTGWLGLSNSGSAHGALAAVGPADDLCTGSVNGDLVLSAQSRKIMLTTNAGTAAVQIDASVATNFVRITTSGFTLPQLGSGGGLVSVGSSDSGGTGFRALRVPN